MTDCAVTDGTIFVTDVICLMSMAIFFISVRLHDGWYHFRDRCYMFNFYYHFFLFKYYLMMDCVVTDGTIFVTDATCLRKTKKHGQMQR